MQGIMHQMGIQMASRARSDLISRYTLRLNPFGIIFRFKIAFDDGNFNDSRRRFIVASSSAVLPEPGEDIKLITSTLWASKCARLCSA